jgi:hypothetical protein
VLELIEGLPDGVVGVEAHGQISAADYEQVLIPAFSAAQAKSANGKVRVLYVLGHEFGGITAGGALKDAELGLGRLRTWERIAIVSDADWIRRAIHGLGWMMPGDVRVFGAEEIDAARSWVTE